MSNELRTQDENLFHSGLNKDEEISFLKEGEYTHAINSFPYSFTGEMHCISNEYANFKCTEFPYPIIGSIIIEDEKHVIFMTDNINSEIGIFDEPNCTYQKIINSPCLKFNQANLIKGVYRKNFACERLVYWNDGVNPSRFLNIDKVPYKYTLKPTKNCPEKVFTNQLDCNAILMSPLLTTPVCTLSEGIGGSLKNGSYRVAIAYSISQIRVSDYLYISDIQTVFSKQNLGRSVVVNVREVASDFDEFQLVLISNIDQQTVAEVVGYYSVSQKNITISSAREQERETIPLSQLTLITPNYWRAEDMTVVNDILLQYRVSTKPDLDYQRQANNIVTRYVAYKVPSNYYRRGGNKVGYMRDEVYAFFIRWVDKGGNKSSWIPIPGRAPEGSEIAPYSSMDAYEAALGLTPKDKIVKKFEIVNTADFTRINNQNSKFPEELLGEGKMAYWQSTEEYPNNPIYDELSCKNIRHHKMPDCEKVPLFATGLPDHIVILGVRFDKIEHPKDKDGKFIEDITSFEIGRSSRKGNASVIAKGVIHNAGYYNDPLNNNQLTLYRNYPQNDLRTDPFLSRKPVSGGTTNKGYESFGKFRDDIFTLHSPDVQFHKINLGQEIKLEGEVSGTSEGTFQEVYKHPKHKLIRDFSLLVASLVGIGEGLLAMGGNKCSTYEGPKSFNPGEVGVVTSTASTAPIFEHYSEDQVKSIINEAVGAGGGIFDFDKTNLKVAEETTKIALQGHIGPAVNITLCKTPMKMLPKALQIANSVFLFAYHFGIGTEAALNLIKKIVPHQQYALQFNSHAFYDEFQSVIEGNKRRYIENFTYSNSSSYQTFSNPSDPATTFQINNTDRPTTVFLKVNNPYTAPKIQDTSRVLVSKAGVNKLNKTKTSAYYASIKQPYPDQYGQINSVEIEHTCYSQDTDIDKALEGTKYITDIIFGGDTYIGRHTEKNIMPFFSQFMYDLPNDFQLDYTKYPNIPYPRFWINTEDYDLSEIVQIPPHLPNDRHSLDNNTGYGKKGTFVIKNGYFYLFVNGITDFYCESTINMDCRSWGDNIFEKYYDPYEFTNTNSLFRSDIITRDNVFYYDSSLSKAEQLNLTNGIIQPSDFSPSECFTYYRGRVIYSLPQQKDLKKDNWRTFLANNYYDFGTNNGTLSVIKPINKTGALFLFEQGSPMMFNGVDSLNTNLGIKVTLGDGGLFAQAPQSVTNSDYSLAACQARWGNINTEFGVFFVSENQGKIFNYSGQLEEISMYGMNSWFRENIPFHLTEDFPGFPHDDNIVIGCGYNMMFDNTYKILYVTKKDWALKEKYKGKVTWNEGFRTEQGFSIELGDPIYFDDASWTISYNPLTKRWVSFHDWNPEWVLQTHTHFVTAKQGSLWKHNEKKDLFCNYYGSYYPWEVEVPIKNGQVTTLSSFEYNLECYVYTGQNYFHVLDWNFDELIVYNSEQISGLHRLNADKSFSNVGTYPYYINEHYESLFTKKEQRYRVNQFWDIVANRGEFIDLERPLLLVEADGYHRDINPIAVNYHKPMIQRKPFRHYWNKIILRRRVCENKSMTFKWILSKKVVSLR